MKEIIYKKLTHENFNSLSLEQFIRHQEVKECWRKIEGEWTLIENKFTENWSSEECKKIAENIFDSLEKTLVGFGAFSETELVGYITLGKSFFGSKKQYVELIEFEVSEPYRNRGIGRNLFDQICQEARRMNAKKLYISAHSSKESQAAYRKLGCTLAEELNPINVEKEPCDVQMEYTL